MLDYIVYIAIGVILLCGLICFIINQNKSVKEWLLLAVSEAEKMYGGKTGRLKLRQVFEGFIKLFPIFSKFVTFGKFSKWVDIALSEMKIMLGSNKAMQEYIGVAEEGEDNGVVQSE